MRSCKISRHKLLWSNPVASLGQALESEQLGILENPRKIWSKSFLSLSWNCFAVKVHCVTSLFTKWNLEQGIKRQNWENGYLLFDVVCCLLRFIQLLLAFVCLHIWTTVKRAQPRKVSDEWWNVEEQPWIKMDKTIVLGKRECINAAECRVGQRTM